GRTLGCRVGVGGGVRPGTRPQRRHRHCVEVVVHVVHGVALGETCAREALLEDLLGGDRAVPGAQGALDAVDPVVDLLRVVALAEADEPESRLRHCCSPAPALASTRATRASRSARRVSVSSTSAASCPRAPSLSAPRVSRMVVESQAARGVSTQRLSTGGCEAVHVEPWSGFKGIGLTCAQCEPRLAMSLSASSCARWAWSLMSRIRAYSILTRRPVASKYSWAAERISSTSKRVLIGTSSSRSSSSGACSDTARVTGMASLTSLRTA